MHWLQPAWLLVLLPLAVAWWMWPLAGRVTRGLRLAVFVLLGLAAGRPAVRLPARGGSVVVVADRSASMPADAEPRQREIIARLEASRPRGFDLGVVAFGESAQVEQVPHAGVFSGFQATVGRHGTRIDLALEAALDVLPADGPGRILLLSDGLETGPEPFPLAARTRARGVAIDVREMSRPTGQDLAVASVDAPARVEPGEGFLITAWIQSPEATEAEIRLERGGALLSAGTRRLDRGLNRVVWRDLATAPGTLSYLITVRSDLRDPVPENNRARFLIGVDGDKPILHLAEREDSGLAAALTRGGLPMVARAADRVSLDLETLSGYRAVVIENLPAGRIGASGMEALAAWVQQLGGGLYLTGGERGFGPGGYYQSALDPVLPVSMELRAEHRKFSVAIAVVLDRSGSMMAPAGGGRTKMDLANMGTAQVLDMLSPMDEFAVLAVDTRPHVVVPLSPVSEAQAQRPRILRIESQGGGIFVYEGLRAAGQELMKSKAANRHIILFADAADAEQPGDYINLLEAFLKAGITVSSVGLGTPADVDAWLLEDVAKRGDGRVFFTREADELPRLFAQDTFAVARNAFIKEPTALTPTPILETLAGRRFGVPPAVGGYSLTYLRPEADLALATADENTAPALASWAAGLGRVATFTPEADGEHAGPFAQWEHAGALHASMVRWVARDRRELPGGLWLDHRLRDGVWRIELHLDPEILPPRDLGAPQALVLRSRGSEPVVSTRIPFRWETGDRLAADVTVGAEDTVLAAVQVGDRDPVALPPQRLLYSPEFQPVDSRKGRDTLRALAEITGGQERLNLDAMWADLPRLPRWIEIAPWLIALAAFAFVLEIACRRLGWFAPGPRIAEAGDAPGERLGRLRRYRGPVLAEPKAAKKPKAPRKPQDAGSGGPSSALAEARRRARERVGR